MINITNKKKCYINVQTKAGDAPRAQPGKSSRVWGDVQVKSGNHANTKQLSASKKNQYGIEASKMCDCRAFPGGWQCKKPTSYGQHQQLVHSHQQLKRQVVRNIPSPHHAPTGHKPFSSVVHYSDNKSTLVLIDKMGHRD